jgi:hypothetical protein
MNWFYDNIEGKWSKLLWLLATAISVHSVFAQQAYASEAAGAVMDQARAECSYFDGGVLETDPDNTISLVDLTGDGKPEEIVDGNKFSCPTSLTLFCGTGGCALTVIVDEKPFEFLAKAWKVVKAPDGKPILKVAVHWSQCDYKDTCWETYKWNGASFENLGSKAE